jgi:transposase
MPKPYSIDLRGRVIEDVESGASRREAAERYGLSPSVVVIWMQRFEETGTVAAKPSRRLRESSLRLLACLRRSSLISSAPGRGALTVHRRTMVP